MRLNFGFNSCFSTQIGVPNTPRVAVKYLEMTVKHIVLLYYPMFNIKLKPTILNVSWHLYKKNMTFFLLCSAKRDSQHVRETYQLPGLACPFRISFSLYDAERRLDVKQTFLNSLQFWKRKPVFLSVKLVFKKKKLPGIIDWTYSFQSKLTSNLRKKEIESFFFLSNPFYVIFINCCS